MVLYYYIIFAFSLLLYVFYIQRLVYLSEKQVQKDHRTVGTTLLLTDRRKWRETLLHFLTRTEWMHARKCKKYMDPKKTVKFLFLTHG